jgi:hypothetical protein
MSKYLRLAAGVLCFGVLALSVVLFDPACPLTFPPQGDSTKRHSLAEEVQRNEELDQREAAIRRRREAKVQVVKEVIARRQSLAEAIEQFRTWDRQWPENASIQTPEDFGMSADEWDGRAVLDHVRQVLADRPNEVAAVASRLEKELQKLLAERKKRRPASAEGNR